MARTNQTLQESLLRQVCKENTTVTVFLKSGVRLIGGIKAFDVHCVLLSTEAQSQLVYKHAIATIMLPSGMSLTDKSRDIEGT